MAYSVGHWVAPLEEFGIKSTLTGSCCKEHCSVTFSSFVPDFKMKTNYAWNKTELEAVIFRAQVSARSGRLLWPPGDAVIGQHEKGAMSTSAIGHCMHDLRHFVPKMCFANVTLLVAL